jgi:hypothetical protein
MQAFGFKHADSKHGVIYPNDIMAISGNNVFTQPFIEFLKRSEVQSLEPIILKPFRWLSTSHPKVGAGFYYHGFGPLPYAFGAVPDEFYYIIKFQGVRNNDQ